MTETTLKYLGDDFEFEPGNGGERDDVIRESRLKTYLIDAPPVSFVLNKIDFDLALF